MLSIIVDKELQHKVILTYQQAGAIKTTGEILNLSQGKVRKILLTAGVFESERSNKIQRLKNSGLSVEEIAHKLGIKKSCVNNYLPYEKCVYGYKNTLNAERIRKCRENKKQVVSI